MAFIRIICFSLVLFLVQNTWAKPVENTSNSIESSEETIFSPKETLMLYTATNFILMGSKYAAKSVKVTKEILKDEDLLANDKPEVLEFKKNLTTFVDSIKKNNDLEKAFDILDIFSNTTEHYLEMPKENETEESKFIVEILNKYKVQNMENELLKEFETFLEQFKTLFVAAKSSLDKPLLEWYDKFITIEDSEKKLESFEQFMELLEDKDK